LIPPAAAGGPGAGLEAARVDYWMKNLPIHTKKQNLLMLSEQVKFQ
jgi:hypothetical protein